MTDLTDRLARRPYPGRGVLAARTTAGELAFVYFLTGRSPASRARELIVLDNGDIAVSNSGGKGQDPLRHYVAAARRGAWTVIGNGDQIIPIADGLAAGHDDTTAGAQHTYEPDPPIFTTRIWLAYERGGTSDCAHGYARRSARDDGAVDHVTWSVSHLAPGTGTLMTTYEGTTTDVRATRAPIDVSLTAPDAEGLLEAVWSALDPALRVAAFVIAPAAEQAQPTFIR